MKTLIDEKHFREVQYSILGKELQTLNILLLPSQGLNVDETSIVCSSDGLTRNAVRKPLWGQSAE